MVTASYFLQDCYFELYSPNLLIPFSVTITVTLFQMPIWQDENCGKYVAQEVIVNENKNY